MLRSNFVSEREIQLEEMYKQSNAVLWQPWIHTFGYQQQLPVFFCCGIALVTAVQDVLHQGKQEDSHTRVLFVTLQKKKRVVNGGPGARK